MDSIDSIEYLVLTLVLTRWDMLKNELLHSHLQQLIKFLDQRPTSLENTVLENKPCLQKLIKLLPCFVIIGIVTLLVGIVFISISETTVVNKEHSVDYTNCEMYDIGADETITCLEHMKRNNDTCVCYHYFNITKELHGNITFFYELESFNQLRKDYVNSRDENQLKGIMNVDLSDKCEPFRYLNTSEGNKPIAPCGAIAEAMFSDTFRLKYMDTELGTYVPTLDTGMLSDTDKEGYRNPDNISVFQNFVKPESWERNLWELDPINKENNGFKNEYFISWMKTEWKKKPFAVLNNTEEKFKMGLPKGQYELRIGYKYPPSRYDGKRKIIISAKQINSHESWLVCGVVATLTGAVLLTAAAGVIFKMKHPEKVPQQEASPLRS